MNQNNENKLKIFETEEFKEITIKEKLQNRYAISNFGRLVSFTDTIEEGRLLKGSITEGFRLFKYKIFKKKKIKNKHKFFYKLVAEYFLEKTSEDQTHIIHIDHNLSNDFVGNLKWVTKEEAIKHRKKSPKVVQARKEAIKRIVAYNKNREGTKLTTTKVMLIKKMLANPNRKTRMKMIAKQFDISEMQLYRIKSGENWGHVKI
jgi:hypothetical protein